MSDAKASKGTTLKIGDGTTPTEVFALIAEQTTIDGPNTSVPTIDVTSHESTAAEFIAGMPDNGEVTFEGLFVGTDSQQQQLWTDRTAGTLRNFEMEFPDNAGANATKFEFAAIVTALNFSAGGVSDPLRISGTLKISGAATITWAAAA